MAITNTAMFRSDIPNSWTKRELTDDAAKYSERQSGYSLRDFGNNHKNRISPNRRMTGTVARYISITTTTVFLVNVSGIRRRAIDHSEPPNSGNSDENAKPRTVYFGR